MYSLFYIVGICFWLWVLFQIFEVVHKTYVILRTKATPPRHRIALRNGDYHVDCASKIVTDYYIGGRHAKFHHKKFKVFDWEPTAHVANLYLRVLGFKTNLQVYNLDTESWQDVKINHLDKKYISRIVDDMENV